MGPTWSGLVALIVALGISPLVLFVLRGRLVDIPNERSSHTKPTPRGGGIAIVAGVIAGMVAMGALHGWTLASLLLALLLGAVGLVDDIKGIPVALRLGVQTTLSAAALLWILGDITEPLW